MEPLTFIQEALFKQQDIRYRDLQTKLIPTVSPDVLIGVRTPALRSYAKQLIREGSADRFLEELPHRFFDENQLHAFILSEERDFARCLDGVNRFLPFIDNWATCDQLSPKCFRKHRPELVPPIRGWIASGETYTIRFGIGMLMAHFLDEDFDPAYPELVASVRSEEYYVNMMIAWYFATALAKQYETVLPWLESRRMDRRTHNKTIQKAIESDRLPEDRKEYLRGLRIRQS